MNKLLISTLLLGLVSFANANHHGKGHGESLEDMKSHMMEKLENHGKLTEEIKNCIESAHSKEEVKHCRPNKRHGGHNH